MIEMIDAHEDKYLDTVRQLFRSYEAELDIDLCFQNFEKELRELPGYYAPPEGCIFLALSDNTLAGCVALRKLAPDICEMKRLYVLPELRNKKIGKALALAVIERAKNIGYSVMKLDTLESMKSAVKLYESIGFKRTSPYCHNPIADAVYMEMTL